MMYLLVKWLHVLSSTILFGTGIGSAFYMLTVSLGKETHTVARVTRGVVVADWLFTTPTAIALPLTGFAMVKLAGMSVASSWLAWSIALYAVAIACWLPVVCLQIRLAAIARRCDEMRAPLTAGYWRLFAWWIGLGVVAFFAFVVIFWFMVTKTV